MRLVAKYPEVAFDTLRDAIRATKECGNRYMLTSHLAGLKDDRVLQFMREEAKGPYLFTRIRAIEFLLQRGQDDAAALLIDEAAKLDRDKAEWDYYLQESLLHCGSEKAIEVVAAHWKSIPLNLRHASVKTLSNTGKDFANRPFSPVVRKAIEQFLISHLDERQENDDLNRTCDLAANALAERLGERKLFDLAAPLSVRNRQIVEIQNVWRKRNALSPLAVPAIRKPRAADDKVLSPYLKSFIESATTAEQQAASEAIERIGLGALPRVRNELSSLPEWHPARERVSKLVSRLSCIVADVSFGDCSIARPEKIRKMGEAMKGRPLAEKEFIELLVAVPKLLSADSEGVLVALDRDGDDTGIRLEFRILPRPDSDKRGSVELRRHELVVVAGKALWNSTASTSGSGPHQMPNEWNSSDWKALLHPLRTAMESPPETQFQVRAETTRGQ